MFNILALREMQIKTTPRFHPSEWLRSKLKTRWQSMLPEDVENEEYSSTAGGLQAGTSTLEINLMGPQKTGNRSTSRSSYATPGHIPKRCSTISQGHVLHCSHSSLIPKTSGNNPEVTQPMRIQKMRFIYTFKYTTQLFKTRTWRIS